MGFNVEEILNGGTIPDGWEIDNFCNYADTNRKSINSRNQPEHIRYIDISSVSTSSYEPPKKMMFPDAPSRARRVVADGDTLISTVRPNLKAYAFIKKAQHNLIASTGFAVISPKEPTDARWVYYLITSKDFTDYLTRVADGAAYPSFNPEHISSARVLVPSKKERSLIGDTLASLDDRITLLRETNATLEAIAQALFKSWFVDFDPVRAKAEGREPEGMSAEVADLFPSEFEESELGEIPKGWKVGTLGDILSIRNDRKKPSEGTIILPYVPIECITSKTIFLYDKKSGEEAQSSLIGFNEGDIVFGAMRPYFHKVCLAPFNGITRTTAFVLKPQKPSYKFFGLLQMFQDETVAYATTHSEGSTIPYAKWSGSLDKKNIIIPPESVAVMFNQTVESLFGQGILNANQIGTLTELRDTLLPRLMSGKLRIPDLEEQAA